MLLQEPTRSPYDIEFWVGPFPVRIAWSFWLMAAIFGYDFVYGIDYMFSVTGSDWTLGPLPLLIVWAACVLISITVHELGHALAFRWCGIHSSIVLYHFGGLAIPLASDRPGHSIGRLSGMQNLIIAAAGPIAQLLLAALVIASVRLSDYEVTILPLYLDRLPGLLGGRPIVNIGLFTFVNGLIWPSIMWAVLNLIPVFPLDGGRIAREVITMFGGTVHHALMLSLVFAVGFALWGFQSGNLFLSILFLSLAAGNWQAIQSLGQWRRF